MTQKQHSRSSEIVGVTDPWAAYQFDNAVSLFGALIESAANETVKRGTEKEPRIEPKYSMRELLSDDFRFPAPPDEKSHERESLRRFAAAIGERRVNIHG